MIIEFALGSLGGLAMSPLTVSRCTDGPMPRMIIVLVASPRVHSIPPLTVEIPLPVAISLPVALALAILPLPLAVALTLAILLLPDTIPLDAPLAIKLGIADEAQLVSSRD